MSNLLQEEISQRLDVSRNFDSARELYRLASRRYVHQTRIFAGDKTSHNTLASLKLVDPAEFSKQGGEVELSTRKQRLDTSGTVSRDLWRDYIMRRSQFFEADYQRDRLGVERTQRQSWYRKLENRNGKGFKKSAASHKAGVVKRGKSVKKGRRVAQGLRRQHVTERAKAHGIRSNAQETSPGQVSQPGLLNLGHSQACQHEHLTQKQYMAQQEQSISDATSAVQALNLSASTNDIHL